MSDAKDKYFEILVREENTVAYTIRANDQQQAERIYNEHSEYYSEQYRRTLATDKYIIDIGETNGPF
jgi:hypothetical protein